MNNLNSMLDFWSERGIPAMTQIIEIVVCLLGVIIIVGAIYEFIRDKSWKKLFHRHNSIAHGKPSDHLKPTG